MLVYYVIPILILLLLLLIYLSLGDLLVSLETISLWYLLYLLSFFRFIYTLLFFKVMQARHLRPSIISLINLRLLQSDHIAWILLVLWLVVTLGGRQDVILLTLPFHSRLKIWIFPLSLFIIVGLDQSLVSRLQRSSRAMMTLWVVSFSWCYLLGLVLILNDMPFS